MKLKYVNDPVGVLSFRSIESLFQVPRYRNEEQPRQSNAGYCSARIVKLLSSMRS